MNSDDDDDNNRPVFGTSINLPPIPGFDKLSREQQALKIAELRQYYYPELVKEPNALLLAHRLEEAAKNQDGPHGTNTIRQASPASTGSTIGGRYDDEESIDEGRAEDKKARQAMAQDNCPPVCPESCEYPYISSQQALIPEDDRDGFDFFYQPNRYRDGSIAWIMSVLSEQLRDWKEFRRWQRSRTCRKESGAHGQARKPLRQTQLEDMHLYKSYHELERRKMETRINEYMNGVFMVGDPRPVEERHQLLRRWIDRKIQKMEELASDAPSKDRPECTTQSIGNAGSKRKRLGISEDGFGGTQAAEVAGRSNKRRRNETKGFHESVDEQQARAYQVKDERSVNRQGQGHKEEQSARPMTRSQRLKTSRFVELGVRGRIQPQGRWAKHCPPTLY